MKNKIYDCETLVPFMKNGVRSKEWVVREVVDIPDGRPVRCKVCKESVRIHRQRVADGPRDHVEHFILNLSCEQHQDVSSVELSILKN